jgi:predicted regulator of amino acid metabolism with ACT domain
MQCPLIKDQLLDCQECSSVEKYWNIKALIEDVNIAAKCINSDFYYEDMTIKDIENDNELRTQYENIKNKSLNCAVSARTGETCKLSGKMKPGR